MTEKKGSYHIKRRISEPIANNKKTIVKHGRQRSSSFSFLEEKILKRSQRLSVILYKEIEKWKQKIMKEERNLTIDNVMEIVGSFIKHLDLTEGIAEESNELAKVNENLTKDKQNLEQKLRELNDKKIDWESKEKRFEGNLNILQQQLAEKDEKILQLEKQVCNLNNCLTINEKIEQNNTQLKQQIEKTNQELKRQQMTLLLLVVLILAGLIGGLLKKKKKQ
jgi:chromosome segregation ATPase